MGPGSDVGAMGQARVTEREELLDLFDAALPQVYHYVLHRCGGVALAEDLTSETLLAAVAAVQNGTVASPTVAWMVGIARHKLVDHWRAAEREERHLRVIASQPPTSVEPVESGRGMEVLARLNPMQRAALTLRHVDGLSVPEVADLLGRSVTATENLLTRARSAFREQYNANDDAEAPGA